MNVHGGRRDRLRELMEQQDCGAFLVTDLVNVRYLCGFSGSNAELLITNEGQWLATDGRYRTQAAHEAPDTELVISRALSKVLLDVAADQRIGWVGFAAGDFSVGSWQSCNGSSGVELRPLDVDLTQMRKVKDADEIDAVRAACEISVRALGALLDEICVGMTEIEIARRLELLMGREGADDRSFETIVASGPNSAIPHHHPTLRRLQVGDLLKIDFGARSRGYHADCTRTFVVGAEPDAWQRQIHALVLAAQSAGMDALAPGRTGQQVDAAARGLIDDAGYGDAFSHGLGHGVGLQIHEAPFLGKNSANTVEARVPLTVEPGIYVPGRGGVRIEDTVLVEDDGIEILTVFPRDLSRVG